MSVQPQLVFLPGLAGDERMWRDVLHRMPTALRPVVTTAHQRSDRTTIEAMACQVLQDHLGCLILAGASMGGMLAMEVVRQAPERVAGLCLLGTTPHPETPPMRSLREAAIVLFEEGRLREVIEPNVALAFHPENAVRPSLVQEYLGFVLDAGAAQLIRQNRAVILRPDARRHLPQVACPTLVLCGEADQITPPACSADIAALVPGAEFDVLPGCGHMLTMEQAEVVSDRLVRFMERQGWDAA